ncbi:unnamed protein product [Brachionus calyciflorus]|uniref:EF-hand domain-containing protein n=1 Tax=Brachionus calyciflorus TaxID=104777 RepID=A0A813RNJ1_9BILA|nr:unnamed protein product [Brachionus calyciflorus]
MSSNSAAKANKLSSSKSKKSSKSKQVKSSRSEFYPQQNAQVDQLADSVEQIRFCSSPKVPFSEVENAIIKSENPLPINETDEIEALNVHGIWANKEENLNWKGPIPLEKYELHDDPNPELLIKKPTEILRYKQEVKIKYLHPPPVEKPGDIIIKQLPNKQIPPAPPLVIRQDQPKPATPPPVVIREEPPPPPPKIPSKVINIKGKVIPPPARKVVVERLPQIPPKPQTIFIERWLPYEPQKRKIIYKKAEQPELIPDPKNMIVDWDCPDVEITQEVRTVGVFRTDPKKYIREYGREAKSYDRLPKIAKSIPAPEGLKLAADQPQAPCPKVEGDIECLRLLDLEKIGLGDCRQFLSQSGHLTLSSVSSSKADSYTILIEDLFRSIDLNNSGLVYVGDVEKVLCGLNDNYGKKLSKKELRKYLVTLDSDKDKHLSFKEFRTAFLKTAV